MSGVIAKLQYRVYVSSQGHLGAVGPRGAVGPQGPPVCPHNVRRAEMTMSQHLVFLGNAVVALSCIVLYIRQYLHM